MWLGGTFIGKWGPLDQFLDRLGFCTEATTVKWKIVQFIRDVHCYIYVSASVSENIGEEEFEDTPASHRLKFQSISVDPLESVRKLYHWSI